MALGPRSRGCYLTFDATSLNVFCSFVPIEVTARMIAQAISEQSKAYSIAVAPESSARNLLKVGIKTIPFCDRSLAVPEESFWREASKKYGRFL